MTYLTNSSAADSPTNLLLYLPRPLFYNPHNTTLVNLPSSLFNHFNPVQQGNQGCAVGQNHTEICFIL